MLHAFCAMGVYYDEKGQRYTNSVLSCPAASGYIWNNVKFWVNLNQRSWIITYSCISEASDSYKQTYIISSLKKIGYFTFLEVFWYILGF